MLMADVCRNSCDQYCSSQEDELEFAAPCCGIIRGTWSPELTQMQSRQPKQQRCADMQMAHIGTAQLSRAQQSTAQQGNTHMRSGRAGRPSMYRGLLIKPEAFLISTYSSPPCNKACTAHCLVQYTACQYTLLQITGHMHLCSCLVLTPSMHRIHTCTVQPHI